MSITKSQINRKAKNRTNHLTKAARRDGEFVTRRDMSSSTRVFRAFLRDRTQ